MPSRKTPDGEFKDIAHPINMDTRTQIQDAVLEKYTAVLEEHDEDMELSVDGEL